MKHDPGAPIVITGAGRNIGAYMAGRFLDAGYPVIAQFRTATKDSDALCARGAIPVRGDFADTAATLKIAKAIADKTPRLRAIIHNASSFAPTAADPAAAARQFQDFFEVHMRAPYLLNTQLAEQLRGTHGKPGDIIHITDIYADNPAVPYNIYCATKAGLQNLSLSFAKQLAPEIKVNVIQPGPISFKNWLDDEQRQALLDATPMHRQGAAEHIYRAVSAIMDNDYQTGAVIAVDGGRRLGH